MTDIKNVTVLGAGNLGAQIAFRGAYFGKSVTSYDINDDALEAAKKRLAKIGENYVRDLDDATEEKVTDALKRITLTSDLEESVQHADLVIEAVPENIDLKRSTYEKLAKAAPAHTIFVTNTSTLLPSSFMDATGRPEQFLALHYANNIHIANVAEVMPTAKTSEASYDAVVKYAEETGMRVIKLHKEQPGYVINSLLVPWLMAGAQLLVRGVADAETIDSTWKALGLVNEGPFRVYDMVGFGVASHVAANSGDPDQKRFAELLTQAMNAGKLGVESGEGFYTYGPDGQPQKAPDLGKLEGAE